MCGRYTAIQLSLFGDDIEIPGNIPPRYNIAPTQDVAVITNTRQMVVERLNFSDGD